MLSGQPVHGMNSQDGITSWKCAIVQFTLDCGNNPGSTRDQNRQCYNRQVISFPVVQNVQNSIQNGFSAICQPNPSDSTDGCNSPSWATHVLLAMDFPPLVLQHAIFCEVLGTALNVFMTSMVNRVKIMLMVSLFYLFHVDMICRFHGLSSHQSAFFCQESLSQKPLQEYLSDLKPLIKDHMCLQLF